MKVARNALNATSNFGLLETLKNIPTNPPPAKSPIIRLIKIAGRGLKKDFLSGMRILS
jgi:hypothetical protein